MTTDFVAAPIIPSIYGGALGVVTSECIRIMQAGLIRLVFAVASMP